ncbi:beta-glucuronidase [Anoplophora glabripennis]|uniref:beta-glucuronidase n=1 Tax=Anoplophora glabripennis TaxID=217634 RepID=UPI0008737A2D|nr:beta-glucuronidase [Anoplophora glabripennis]
MRELLLTFLLLVATITQGDTGVLYPRSSITREVQSLDGLWKFSLCNNSVGVKHRTQTSDCSEYNDDEDLELMPVPSSYNDISIDDTVRDHVGVVKYQRSFIVPKSWAQKTVWLRFGSVCYAAEVYLNGKLAMSHEIGHLPFAANVSPFLKFANENDIVVLVNNTLTNSTIPQGTKVVLPSGRIKQEYTFDFFNYAGIDRPVVLYTTEDTYVDDITITTQLSGTTAIVTYDILVEGNDISDIVVTAIDKGGKYIASNDAQTLTGTIKIENAKLWWPYLMDAEPGYLYTLRVEVFNIGDKLLDRYDQPFGIRELTWDNTTFKINGKPLYLRGFGRHEDSDIRGKGLDLPLIIRDHNLIKWVGANSYRTSHYPYAEEIMDLADSLGIMIIDECPAVNTQRYNKDLLENHKKSLTELINRDKNRPSVIIWSASNEPSTQYNESGPYYKEVIAHIKSLDTSRPATVVNSYNAPEDHSGQFLDILCFNKYLGWYDNPGDLDVIVSDLKGYAEAWHRIHNKTVIVTEYGADTLEGLHFLPTYIWSEEYQTDLMSRYFQAFDELREKGWFVGEMIWNFADFKTAQTYTRVGGNKKGIFTRQRQPKASAHLLRRRYWALAGLLDNATQPDDLDEYII